MRSGTAVLVSERFSDDERGQGTSNWLILDHGDWTFGTYFDMAGSGRASRGTPPGRRGARRRH